MKAAKIILPQIVIANDYHAFFDLQETLNSVTDIKVKTEEIGFSRGEYVGILYAGTKPKKEEIQKMLAKKKITLE